jgi:hypothetical protein
LKIKWRRILRIIWRKQASWVGPSVGMSVKRPMSGHSRNVRQSWDRACQTGQHDCRTGKRTPLATSWSSGRLRHIAFKYTAR